MRVLFLHDNFPAHYRDLAPTLAADATNEVVFATHQPERELPGVEKVLFSPHRGAHDDTHPYVKSTERAVINGQSAYRMATELRAKGFVPDIICAHSGWGPGIYMKDAFPEAKLLSYFEWYYNPRGSNNGFLPEEGPMTEDRACAIRTRNGPILLDLAHCDYGITGTNWTMSQFPEMFRQKIVRLHDGINTDFWSPLEPRPEMLINGRDTSTATEFVTYTVRGMEPYRGFPTFMRMVEVLLKQRPGLHFVVAGEDRVSYGSGPESGENWRQYMLSEVDIDPARVHFVGHLAQTEMRHVLRAGNVHTHMTVPFLPNWSLFEAMSVGALVVASDVEVCRELITDGQNGYLVDFFDHEAWAARVSEALDTQDAHEDMRRRARETVTESYDLSDILPKQLRLIEDIVAGRTPQNLGHTIEIPDFSKPEAVLS